MINLKSIAVSIFLLSVFVTGCNTQDSQLVTQLYAGMETRSIKALSEEKIQGLLEGKGLEYALAAELNQYPGPLHALDLTDELDLNEEQEEELTKLKEKVVQEAKNLGKQYVALEKELDQSFAVGTITEEQLEKLTNEIALVDGQLRNAHLKTHLEVKEILTPDQVKNYDKLRGYTGDFKEQNEHNHH